MAKKKSNSTPNIPDEVMERVRQENGESSSDLDAEMVRKKAERRAERAARRAARKQSSGIGEKPKKNGELNATVVAEMLAHPTTEVKQEELEIQYGYVISDLRNMGILAGILLVVLIGLGFFI